MDGNERQSAPDDADAAGAPEGPQEGSSSARPADEAGTTSGDNGAASSPATPEAGGASTSGPWSPGPAGGPAPAARGDAAHGGAATTVQTPTAPPPGPAPAQPGSTPGPPASGTVRSGPPKIFDLPDEQRPGRTDGTIVLGGAAAAEGRTTGPNPRIAGPAPKGSRLSGAGAGSGDGDSDDAAESGDGGGRHFSPAGGGDRNWLPLALAAVPIVALVLLIGGWAVDTAALSGQVMRNVEVAGRSVGGLGEASLPDVMTEINDEVAARTVVVTSGDRRYDTTAGELGLSVDPEATADAALDAGRDDSLLTRPFTWLSSFFSPREVDVHYSVKESQVVAKMLELQGPELLAPHDPTIQLGEQGWVLVPGTPGQGVDTNEIVTELPELADTDPTGTIEVETDTVEVAPRFTDAQAQELADRANTMTANGITLTAGESSVEVGAETLRTWVAPTTENGELDLVILPDVVNAALPELFSDLSAEPVNASFDLQGGTPVVVPSKQGITCCGPTSPDLVWEALSTGQATAALEVTITEPEITTEAAQALGIVQPVGGNNAWRDGGPTTAGPGFTTYHDCCAPRVTNIHRMADIVRGTVVLPGETFSINDTVGERTAGKGFVPAGAIAQGEHRDEIGGGVSQFATTTFNAAYFAGLDIPVYQAHSEYFSRYPLGREATMGYPNPDLQFTNNTPYGIMIWTSYTDTSLTVTLYSTPHATGAQTGISESMEGQCRIVTTTRTRTWPDGRTANDTFRARYRPGAGLNCNGEPINPGGTTDPG